MRYVALICLCLLFGFVLGRWGPAEDLRRARSEIQELREGGRGGPSRPSVAVAAREFLQIEATPTKTAEPAGAPAPSTDEPTPAPPPLETNTAAAAESGANTNAPPSMEEQLDKAKELWRTRAELARNSFLQNTEADEQEVVRFDVLIQGMNIRLKSHIDEWVDGIREQEEIRAEDGARLIHALSGDVVLTYDEFDRSFEETWREDSGSDFKLFDFVDPSVADSLTGIEDKLDAFEP